MDAAARGFYRPEIDGLRALAVVPVILFHAGFAFVAGGFVGVDIFFVISGYLITGILLADMSAGRFSLWTFYERRARRILPALFVVLAATLPFALWWMADRDLSNLGRSMVAVGSFVSNLFFWKNTDYFDPAAGEQPLLHTWSLAVEEQYYLFFPLALLLIHSLWRRATGAVLLLATLGSLALAQWCSNHHPTINFYFLPTRAWELLAGACVAAWLHQRGGNGAVIHPLADRLLALLGIGLMLYALVCFNDTIPSPSLYIAMPVAGACLFILFARHDCPAGRLLALKPLVAVGLISYSAYLWHQPLLALFRLSPLEGGQNEQLWLLGISAAVFVLAWLSWKHVEQPFRQRGRFSRAQVLGGALLGLVAVVAAGAALAARYKVEERVNPDIAVCVFAANPEASCRQIGSGPEQVVVIGDSHALPLAEAFEKDPARTYTIISIQGCPPLIGVRRYDGIGEARNCDKPGQTLGYAQAVADLHPAKVLLVGRWTLYVHGWQRKNVLQRRHHLLEPETGHRDDLAPEQVLAMGLRNTAAWFHEHAPATHLYVLEQVPDLQMFGPVKTALRSVGAAVPRSVIDGWDNEAEQALATLETTEHVTVVRSKPAFCDTQSCQIAAGEDYLYADDNHLSESGAKRLVGPLRQALSSQPVIAVH